MTDIPGLSPAAQRFIADMTAAGASARVDGARILYDAVAIDGALAGHTVTTGVSIQEVQSWPAVPPHWIHLPDSITFAQTNMDQNDCPPGWHRHSRDYSYTDTNVPPALSWLRHVRGVLSIALAQAA